MGLIRYLLILLVVGAVSIAIHLLVLLFLDLPVWEHRILLAYIGNFILAAAIVIGLLKAPKKFKNSLGFLFMLGSGLKFIFFFSFFYSRFLEDGDISRVEFFTFFIPYSLSLITETKLLINKLSE